MKKADTVSLFWSGHALGALAEAFQSQPTGESLARPAFRVDDTLNGFADQEQFLPVARQAAKKLIFALRGVYYSRTPQSEKETGTPKKPMSDPFTAEEIEALGAAIFSFQSILVSELPQANIYHVTQKCAYDMAILINDGEHVLPEGILDRLKRSKNKLLNDLREATRCLAFNLCTGVGFHVYRAIEAIVVDDYFHVLKIEQPKNRNMGEYIKLLKEHGVDEKVTAPLFHIKDHYRNPISHPEEFWDQSKAEGAFGLAVSAIIIMAQDLMDRLSKQTGGTEEATIS